MASRTPDADPEAVAEAGLGLEAADAFDLHGDARSVLLDWHPLHPDQQALKGDYLAFLDENVDAMWRSSRIGHLTASALVLDDCGERVLLTLHPRVGRWLQLGGHCESADLGLREAARREVVEECGIEPTSMSVQPVRLDRHAVPCGGEGSEHLDVQYLAVVPTGAMPVISDESDDLRWFGLDDLPDGLDSSVQSLIRDALAWRAKRA
jgi:8-oxo-dGTP pyrophosphatase MutT (NUDIX family)